MKKKEFVLEAVSALREVKMLHSKYSKSEGSEKKAWLRDFKAEYRYLYELCTTRGGDLVTINGLQEALVHYGFLYTVANLDTLNELEGRAANNILESRKRRQNALPPGEEVTVTVTKIRGRNYSAIEGELAKALRDA